MTNAFPQVPLGDRSGMSSGPAIESLRSSPSLTVIHDVTGEFHRG
jgi:hypothetical protein